MLRKLSQPTHYAMVILLAIFACEESVETTDDKNNLTNTLSESSIGNGSEGDISSYFYNFNNNINAQFYKYDATKFNLSYEQYINLMHEEPDLLTLKNFPEYLAEVTPADIQYTERTGIDSLTMEIIEENSIEISSNNFTHVEELKWDSNEEIDAQRYEITTSDIEQFSTTIQYSDTLISISYQAVVDTPLISDGLMFVDQSEWVDTSYSYSSSFIPFTHTFIYEKTQLNSELLMYRQNTDCNHNGQWDDVDYFDPGNGVWDPAEAYYESNNQSGYQIEEPFEDRDCDGVWDEAEVYTDLDSNGLYDFGEPFEDVGHDTTQLSERFTDLNENSIAEPNELFVLSPRPNNLLVSWEDINNPRILTRIVPGDSLVDLRGVVHRNIIETVTVSDVQNRATADLDSVVTLYTNKIIEHIPTGNGGQYYITKTEWTGSDNIRRYDYLLFKENGHIFQVIHPTYFLPDGFIWNFWSSNDVVDEVLYYTVNGKLRDGEIYEEVYFDTTSIAIYQIEKSFTVESDTITVPAKSIRYFTENDTIICYGNEDVFVTDPADCPAADTTFYDCFKITRNLTMTLLGNGVEFGTRSVTWLARDMGIVRDELSYRWTEDYFTEDENWVGLSKWELGKFTHSSNNALGRILANKHTKKLNEFQSLPDFENDPYQINHIFGLQRVVEPED